MLAFIVMGWLLAQGVLSEANHSPDAPKNQHRQMGVTQHCRGGAAHQQMTNARVAVSTHH
ncbi:hypothetical protein DK37_05730 [Halomonas sp. SUBG004]|nr:hypothetical protein DK37_05730 [Halomonas sp. SUBG004]